MRHVLALTTIASIAIALPAAADEFKVALLTQGSATESGWNRVAYDGLRLIGAELGASISNVELDANPASYEKAFLDYAADGYDMVIGHGFQFGNSALAVGPEFPDTTFIVTSSNIFEGNVVGVNLNTYQPFFLMGVIAAKRSDKVGYIGGLEIPPITQAAIGFRNGVHHVAPDMEVLEVMTGSWSDLPVAKEAALGMIAAGADMIVPNANISSLGVFQAAVESGPRIASFGTFGDYTENAPKNILGNYIPDLGRGLVRIAAQIKDGSFSADSSVLFGLETADVMVLTFNKDAAEPVSDELLAELDAIKAQLIAGEIDPTKVD